MILGIYGSNGLGHEVSDLVDLLHNRWEKVIFIDDTKTPGIYREKELLSFEDVKKTFSKNDIEIVIATGEPRYRRLMREKVQGAGFELATIIHPSVIVPKTSTLGAGVVICSNAFVSCDVKIGDNSFFQPNGVIGHDNTIGKDTVMGSLAFIGGNSNIGDEVYLAPHSAIKDHISIGSESIVGVSAVVINNVPNQSVVAGNPAVVIRKNDGHTVFER